MHRVIRVLIIILFILPSLLAWVPAKTLCSNKLNKQKYPFFFQVQPTNLSPVKMKEQNPKFKIGMTGRALSGKYSLALTVEPLQTESLLTQGRIKIGSKTRTLVRIIFYIPRRMEKKEGRAILTSSDKKTRMTGKVSTSSTSQTTASGDMPAKGELVIKDTGGKILDVIQFQALDNSKSVSDLPTSQPDVSAQKPEWSGNLYLSTEEALLELTVATGGFHNSVVTFSNQQDEPIHVRKYLQYAEIKSPLGASYSGGRKREEFFQWVIIEYSKFNLGPGEEKRVDIIGCPFGKEENQYYARVILEVDSLSEEEEDIDSDQSVQEELLASSNNFKENDSGEDEPLEFILVFRGPKKVQLTSSRKISIKDRESAVEQILLARELEFIFPDGIEDVKVVYEKKLFPGKYTIEMNVQQDGKTSIWQSHTVSVN